MLDQIMQLVKEQIGNDSAIASAIPAQQRDAVSSEIASHISDKMGAQGMGGMLSMLGGMDMNSITAGLAEKLTSKFGLPSSVTAAIIAALPGLLQKLTGKSDSNPLGGLGSKLGGLFG